MNEGLVAPSWSDSGDVPVGEVTYTSGAMTGEELWRETMWIGEMLSGAVPMGQVTSETSRMTVAEMWAADPVWPGIAGLQMLPGLIRTERLKPAKPSDPNAKPALSALSKVAGESYRGLGWCDE